jgi:hypothetical protein
MALRRHRNPSRPGRAVRLQRSFGLDRNPLRRSIDRIEAWVRCGLVAVFLTFGPLLAAYVVHRVESASHLAERTQAAWHRVTGLVLKEMPGPNGCAHWPCEQSNVLARWTAPGGLVRTGVISVNGGAAVGATLAIWLNAHGQPVGPPDSHAWVIGEAAAAGAGALGAVALACAFGAKGTARTLQRRKLAHWEADWTVFGPRWTKRT